MENTYNKISETELEVIKEIPQPEVVKTVYERSFIEEQIKTIQADKDRYDEARDKEIRECMDILVAMDEQGVVKKEDTTEDIK